MSRGGAIPYFGDAYMADTRHLTLEEHGAYHLLLLIAWRSPSCSLPDDDKRLSQMLGITPKKWAAIKPTVMAFWSHNEHGWEQKRLTKERRWVEEKSRKNKASAEARWGDKSLENNDQDDANASPNADADAHANGDAPPPPPTKSSEANASGGEPPADLKKQVFDLGLSLVMQSGKSEAEARQMVGLWRKSKTDAEVMAAFMDCQAQGISSPLEWLQARFKGSRWISKRGYEYRGSDEEVLKEAERRGDMDTYWSVKAAIGRAKEAKPATPKSARRTRGAAPIGDLLQRVTAGAN